MKQLIYKLHKSQILGRIFHTLDFELCRELSECETVLDIGCGPSSPLQNCNNISYSLGVEAFKPYLIQSKKKKIHSEYLNKKIEDLDFPENSFDAVMAIEVIEHLPRKTVTDFLKKANKWAKKKIIISTPNGFIPQKEVDSNPLQKHLSGWTPNSMKKLGFRCYGLAGLKYIRDNSEKDTMDDNDLTASIKYNPKWLWFAIATISQVFTFFLPNMAFEIFCVKSLNK